MGQRKDTLPGIGGLEAAYREARKSHEILTKATASTTCMPKCTDETGDDESCYRA
jgi:hypothetical protein